jgi:hypothetical protein
MTGRRFTNVTDRNMNTDYRSSPPSGPVTIPLPEKSPARDRCKVLPFLHGTGGIKLLHGLSFIYEGEFTNAQR